MIKPWQLIRSDNLIKNRWLTVEQNSYEVDGRVIDDYFVVRRKPFVLVVAQQGEQVVLVRQYRPATEKFYLSLPAGYIEEGEDPRRAAQRELLEETCLEGRSFTVVGAVDPLPGYISSRATVVWCEFSSTSKHSPIGHEDLQDSEESEAVEVEYQSWPDVTAMILSGAIDEMQAVVALLLAKEWLRSSAPTAVSGDK